MTTQVGTFIPVQAQYAGLGINGLNQNSVLGFNGFNPNTAVINTAGYNQIQNNNPNAAALFVVPNYGNQSQAFGNNGTQVAFIPQNSALNGASLLSGNASVQGIPTAATVFGVANALQGSNQSINTPSLATELSENNNEYVISFDVPGIEIQDLDISLSGNTILINGVRKNTYDSSTLAYSEVARGSLSRAIAVPFDISPSKAINTSLENGVLKIRIAKENQSERKSSTRKVKIG
jgi:HSP20 family protein